MPGQIAPGGISSKLRLHIFEFATTVAWLLIGLTYLLNHTAGNRSAIGQVIHPFDYFWCTGYVAAAPLVIYGIAREQQRFRVAGLNLLGTALFMNFIAALAVKPLELRDFTYLVFALACFIRGLLAAETVRPILSRRLRR